MGIFFFLPNSVIRQSCVWSLGYAGTGKTKAGQFSGVKFLCDPCRGLPRVSVSRLQATRRHPKSKSSRLKPNSAERSRSRDSARRKSVATNLRREGHKKHQKAQKRDVCFCAFLRFLRPTCLRNLSSAKPPTKEPELTTETQRHKERTEFISRFSPCLCVSVVQNLSN